MARVTRRSVNGIVTKLSLGSYARIDYLSSEMRKSRSELAFARVVSNLILGGSATFALLSLFRIWMKEQRGPCDRER